MDKIQKIKALLREKKITYDDFSKMIGKSKPTIVNYFKGASRIDIDTIEKIAKALDVPVIYFFDKDFTFDKRQNNYIDYVNLKSKLKLIRQENEELKQKLKKELSIYKEKIELKDEIINLLKDKIELLNKQ